MPRNRNRPTKNLKRMRPSTCGSFHLASASPSVQVLNTDPGKEDDMSSRRRAAVMYLIAAACFLIAGIAGFLGGMRANIAFIVLSVAFGILALNFWTSTKESDNS